MKHTKRKLPKLQPSPPHLNKDNLRFFAEMWNNKDYGKTAHYYTYRYFDVIMGWSQSRNKIK